MSEEYVLETHIENKEKTAVPLNEKLYCKSVILFSLSRRNSLKMLED